MIRKQDALFKLKPNAKWVWRGDDYNGLEWHDENQSKPTEQEILDKQAELQADYDSKEYQRLRAAEYPSIQDQLDMQYWDSVNGTTTWDNAIAAIKAKYPKPNN